MYRKDFEEWIAAGPFERAVDRWPDDLDNYSWPGHYIEYEVELAWEAYQEAIKMLERKPLEQLKRICVCGGRDFSDWRFLEEKMKIILETDWMFVLVHGDARGADKLAAGWGNAVEVIVEAHPADWKQHGRAAGPIRNQEMLDSGLDGIVAFPGGRGTANMVKLGLRAGVPVWDLRDGL